MYTAIYSTVYMQKAYKYVLLFVVFNRASLLHILYHIVSPTSANVLLAEVGDGLPDGSISCYSSASELKCTIAITPYHATLL